MNLQQTEFYQVYQHVDKALSCDREFFGRLQLNNVIQILFVCEEEEIDSDSNTESYNKESTIIQEIIAKTVVAVCDTSVNIGIIAGV